MNNRGPSKEQLLQDVARLSRSVSELETHQLALGRDLALSRTANKFLSSVLDTVDALVVVVDASGRIVRLNQAFQQTLGEAGQPLDGPLWDLFLLPDDIAAVRGTVGKLLAGRSRTATDNFWLSKGDNLRLISWSFTCCRAPA